MWSVRFAFAFSIWIVAGAGDSELYCCEGNAKNATTPDAWMNQEYFSGDAGCPFCRALQIKIGNDPSKTGLCEGSPVKGKLCPDVKTDAASVFPAVFPSWLGAPYVRGDNRTAWNYYRKADHKCSYPNDPWSCENIQKVKFTRSMAMKSGAICGVCLPRAWGSADKPAMGVFCSEKPVGVQYDIIHVYYRDDACTVPVEKFYYDSGFYLSVLGNGCNGKCSTTQPEPHCEQSGYGDCTIWGSKNKDDCDKYRWTGTPWHPQCKWADDPETMLAVQSGGVLGDVWPSEVLPTDDVAAVVV